MFLLHGAETNWYTISMKIAIQERSLANFQAVLDCWVAHLGYLYVFCYFQSFNNTPNNEAINAAKLQDTKN